MKHKKQQTVIDNLSAEHFYQISSYIKSRDKVYDDLEHDVYENIEDASNKGHFFLMYPLKMYDNTFDRSWSLYKVYFEKLISNLLIKGFHVRRKGNYLEISWDIH